MRLFLASVVAGTDTEAPLYCIHGHIDQGMLRTGN